MGIIGLILMVLAFVLFLVRTKWSPPGYELMALGLACWVLATLLAGGLPAR